MLSFLYLRFYITIIEIEQIINDCANRQKRECKEACSNWAIRHTRLQPQFLSLSYSTQEPV